MKCSRCSKKAVIYLRSYRLALCREHFTERFLNTVEKAIKEHKMFSRKQKILIAISGGKDSLALWDALRKLGYSADGLYIDLGISREQYSYVSKKKAKSYAEERDAKLIVVDLREEYGRTIEDLARKRRKVCSLCGTVKRHEFDRVAHEHGYDVLATGHNLDDEVAVLLGNVLRWNLEYLAKQSPKLEAWHPKLKPKVKPLCYLTERETATYCFLNEIDYIYELECPYSTGATSLKMKEIMNKIEELSPGTKLYFYREFLKKKPFKAETKMEVKECSICGFPALGEVCSFCRAMRTER